ncbi:phasin family protein [Sphingomonas sp.]|uniref:phasin family protein n=1 Tax=Sphingomonas sp. TaxID=28214 RepID=UPI003B3A1A86
MTDKSVVDPKPAAKPRKSSVPKPAVSIEAEKAVNQSIAAGDAAVAQLTPSPAQIAETLEAVTSPAIQSDPIEAPVSDIVEPAPVTEEVIDMATVTSPTDTANQAQAAFGDVSNRFKSAFEKSTKLGEEMVDFAKGNVEAVIASSKVAAKATESLGQEAAEYGKKHFEAATAAFKSFASVKSPTELFQLQSEFAKSSFDSMVAEASRLSETLMKVAGDVAQPISTRYAIAAEKIKSTSL